MSIQFLRRPLPPPSSLFLRITMLLSLIFILAMISQILYYKYLPTKMDPAILSLKNVSEIEHNNETSSLMVKNVLKFSNDNLNWKQYFLKESLIPVVIGQQQTRYKFLTIGVPTIHRESNYLRQTLQSLCKHSTAEERLNTSIVLYLADLEPHKRETQLKIITQHFQQYLDSGFINIIYSRTNLIYPSLNFKNKSRSFNDTPERVQWRSKQALDFAFLMSYSKHLSKFYMILEDDIRTVSNYLTTIRTFIESRQQSWTVLEFTEFLIIGLLFYSEDIEEIANFLLMFYEDQPVDLLIRAFIKFRVRNEWSIQRRLPSIFQHFGIVSTLKNKAQPLIDYSFETAIRKYKNKNPPAKLYTSMQVYKECYPYKAYNQAPGFFWGITGLNNTEYINITFQSKTSVNRIIILSGMIMKKLNLLITTKDIILVGYVQFSKDCKSYNKINETFHNGVYDVKFWTPIEIYCLQIIINTGNSHSWIVIKEIEIFTS